MRYNSVTIWHKNNNGYERIFFERANVVQTLGISGGAAGEEKENSVTARVYTLYNCGISAGDRLSVGYDEAVCPPEDAYLISEITGYFNASAALRHYKIKCR